MGIVLYLFVALVKVADLCLSKKLENSFISPFARYSSNQKSVSPLVLTTWAFTGAAEAALEVLEKQHGSALDAVIAGGDYCERMQCDFTVGFGGSPDETGETTLDAMIFDGDTFDMGAVGDLRRVKHAISVANKIRLHSKHSILVGDAATNFAKQMGFEEESLSTNRSTKIWEEWKKKNCQPNFWKDVTPDSTKNCGPYKSALTSSNQDTGYRQPGLTPSVNFPHYDTIGMIAMDANGSVAVGLSSNGATHKIPGRMGDAAVPGAGGYADSRVGGAAATGDGDVMMRFLPAALIVEKMKKNMSPQKATTLLIKKIREFYPSFQGGLVGFNKKGELGAACNKIGRFPYTVAKPGLGVRTYYVNCN